MSTATLTDRDAGRAAGEARRDAALSLLAMRRDIIVRRARRALLAALLATGEASADDVRDAIALPDGIDPTCLGAVPIPLARAGIIRADGYVRTSRAVAHVRPVTRWTLADSAAARQWLADHPDLPDPPDQDQDGPQRLLFVLHANEATPTAGTAGAAAF